MTGTSQHASLTASGGRASSPNTGRVLDALEVGVIVHDAALRIVYTNGAAAALLGVEVAEAIQRDVADPRWVVIHPDGSPVPPDQVPASVCLRTRKPARGMILGVCQADGGTTWALKQQGLGGDDVHALAMDANDPQKLYAWVVDKGLYRSTDGGDVWARVNDGPQVPGTSAPTDVKGLLSVNIPTGMGGIYLAAATAAGFFISAD